MAKYRIFFLLIVLPACVHAQLSDIISVRKKNGRTIQSFTKGSPIIFINPASQTVEGRIHEIRDDSVFVTRMDIRTYYTQLGATVTDTIAAAIFAYHYKELTRIRIYHKKGTMRNLTSSVLMIGGAAYIVLNVVNGLYLGEPIADANNLGKLGIAAGAVAVGFAMKKLMPANEFSKPKHQVVYIKMSGAP
jgi:hypothetical protein